MRHHNKGVVQIHGGKITWKWEITDGLIAGRTAGFVEINHNQAVRFSANIQQSAITRDFMATICIDGFKARSLDTASRSYAMQWVRRTALDLVREGNGAPC